ncbi:TerC family protein [Blastococcus sp. MG754426]|uniref:TerC family protein n=1 Tax=unclassified Blastococcus TaxID=2619396 RepID=UPI001EF14F8E|nr:MULTISPECIES: TerC family protein [unclassified Blastococcus]MCF6507305.1 TerC family protein [Blastococcus sp. MG754426]MCF6510791.1 TerC family protein [Blastococcus sp. MG754427]MCF6734355.1 TerC family protein [Blastococcus sp. KM273129]
MDVPLWLWAAVLGLVLGMLAVDLFAHRRAHVIGVREAAAWSAVWVAIGVGFGAWVWWSYGAELGQQYYAGYLIEKSLAVDNVFVWAILFTYFAVPREYQHRVLFLGVVGALVFRGLFIAGGSVLIASFGWVLYVFAAFLLLTGYRMLRQRNDHLDPDRSRVLRLFRRWVPMTDVYHGQRFLVRRGGKLLATPLLAVLVLVEVTDVLFAVDSIPAIFAVTDEPFLVFTANAFAVLGLRAMYFLLADLIHRFVYLKTGLALVLVWVGIKMLLKIDVFYIPTTISLAVVATIIGTSVWLSLRATRGQGRQALPAPADPPFAVATPEEDAVLEPVWRRRPVAAERGRTDDQVRT